MEVSSCPASSGSGTRPLNRLVHLVAGGGTEKRVEKAVARRLLVVEGLALHIEELMARDPVEDRRKAERAMLKWPAERMRPALLSTPQQAARHQARMYTSMVVEELSSARKLRTKNRMAALGREMEKYTRTRLRAG
jgi:hypothetical protein